MNALIKIFVLLMTLSLVAPTAADAQRSKTKSATTQKKTRTTNKKQKATKKVGANGETTNVNSLKSKRDELQKKIKDSQYQLNRTNKDVKVKLQQLKEINGQIDLHQHNIGKIKGQIDSVNTNIGSLEKELATLMAQLKDCKRKYARSMLYMYQNRKTSNKMLFLMSATDFTQMARRYKYVKEYSKYQRVQGEMMQRKQAEVEEAKNHLTRERNHHTRLLQSEQEENRQLAAKQTEQQTAVEGLQKKQKNLQQVLANDKKEMAQLNAKIDYYVKLAIEQERKRREEAERKRRELAERQRREAREAAERQRRDEERRAANDKKEKADKADKAAKASRSSRSSKSNRNENSVAETPAPSPRYMPNDKEYALTNNFASNRGRLPMPITGSYVVSTHYGSYTMPGTNVRLDSKGINLTGKSGAQARCIFDGEVTAIFSAGGTRNVMVRHGSYISIYCNLVSVSVSQGQRVSARQTLGTVAADASGRPNLHFQLRKEASTLNPEAWLAR